MGKAKNQHPGQPNSVPSSFANSCVRVCKPHGSRFSDFPHLIAEGRTKAILVSHKNQRSKCCPQLHPSLAPQSAPNRKKSSHRARSIASSKLCIRLSISLCLRSTLTTWTLPPPRHELSYSSTVCRCVHVHMCSEPNKYDEIQPLCFQKSFSSSVHDISADLPKVQLHTRENKGPAHRTYQQATPARRQPCE